MADSVELKVYPEELQIFERDLSALSKSISNRRLNVQITTAKGAVADNLMDAAKRLNDVATALAGLIQKTEVAVTNARAWFVDADNANAQSLGSLGE